MSGWGLRLVLFAAIQGATGSPAVLNLFEQGQRFGEFVSSVKVQRDLWRKNVADAIVPPDLLARFTRVAPGLRLLVVAEDWCPDSVYAVPYIARLADTAGVELRVVDRKDGGPIMQRHTTPDGRQVTPTVVLLRRGQDVGAWLDSWAARVWVTPGRWTIQASHGFLHEPEQLESGDQRRTNASVSWLRTRERDYSALTVAAGRVERQYSTLNGLLAEGTHHVRRVSLTGRFEWRTEETEILLFPEIVHRPHPGELVDPIAAATAGAVYDVAYWGPLSIGAGGDATPQDEVKTRSSNSTTRRRGINFNIGKRGRD